jgi:ATP-dependent Clp protease ATP-binding subunit ClpB
MLSFFFFLRAVQALLQAGADPNLGDEFINAIKTAKENNLHSLHGEL